MGNIHKLVTLYEKSGVQNNYVEKEKQILCQNTMRSCTSAEVCD